jgi:hypothetical protein
MLKFWKKLFPPELPESVRPPKKYMHFQQKCENCTFFTGDNASLCRAHPPGDLVTNPEYWCGEWRQRWMWLDENVEGYYYPPDYWEEHAHNYANEGLSP